MSRATKGAWSRWLAPLLDATPKYTPVIDIRGQYIRVDGTELDDFSTADSHGLGDAPDGQLDPTEPTEHQLATLPRIADDLPWSAFLVAVVELCERFAYYGLAGPLQNYIANKYHDPNGLPGAIGLGQAGATAMTNFFIGWCSTTPIFAAIIADQYLGRYATIFYAMLIYMFGLFILFVTSLPAFIEGGLAFPGLMIAMVVIGLGTGGIKANVSTLIAEQYLHTKPYLKTLKSGKKVLVDPAMTIGRIFSIFYLCVNVGSLSPVLTTTLEANVGFWASYLLCFGMFVVGFITLVAGKKNYILRSPTGSPVFDAFRIIGIGLRSGSLNAAKPENVRGRATLIPWTSSFVDELKRALVACRVLLFFPIYWLAYNQMSNNFVSQAGQMERHSIPNDIMVNIDPICIIVLIPICDKYIFPWLARHGFKGHINKITLGFLLGALAMFWAAFLQNRIYTTGPCYTSPGDCPAGLRPDGSHAPNEVSVLWQVPAYLIIAVSEIFASVPGLEFAYTNAPADMKSFVMGLYSLTGAFGAALGIAVSPFAIDPLLTSVYFWLAVVSVVSAGLFWLFFRHLDQEKPSHSSSGEQL